MFVSFIEKYNFICLDPCFVYKRHGPLRPIRGVGSHHSPAKGRRNSPTIRLDLRHSKLSGRLSPRRGSPSRRLSGRLSPRRISPSRRLSPPLTNRRSPRRSNKDMLGLSQVSTQSALTRVHCQIASIRNLRTITGLSEY